MKIRIFLLSFLLSFTIFADYDLRGSYGFLYNEQISNKPLASGSYSMTGEYYIEPLDRVSIGFGAIYSWPAEFKTIPKTLKSNPIDTLIPIYGSIILSILPDSPIEPYLIGRLGYTVMNPNKNSAAKNLQGDMYTSIGFGGYYNDFFLEGTYDSSKGYYTLSSKNVVLDYTHFTLRFGYRFNFERKDKKNLFDTKKEIIIPNIKDYDNLEKFDDKGNIIEKKGTYQELEDYQIIE